jgi:hypothetical protein
MGKKSRVPGMRKDRPPARHAEDTVYEIEEDGRKIQVYRVHPQGDRKWRRRNG